MVEVEHLGAREHVVFGGRVPVDPHNFIERAMAKNTPAEFAEGPPRLGQDVGMVGQDRSAARAGQRSPGRRLNDR